jgi:hypothetical protein
MVFMACVKLKGEFACAESNSMENLMNWFEDSKKKTALLSLLQVVTRDKSEESYEFKVSSFLKDSVDSKK